MSSDPLISVIIPSLSQAAFIGRTLNSVLGQDFADLECLVMDGGSTDGTLGILSDFEDRRLKIISKPDRGQSDALNQGVARARGQILGWLNADDCYLPSALSRVTSFFDAHSEADVLYGRARVIDDQDDLLYIYPTECFDRDRLFDRCFLCQSATFVRKSFYDQVGPLDSSLHFCLDYDWWLRGSSRSTRFSYLPEFLGVLRLHPACKTMRRREALDETLRMLTTHRSSVSMEWIFASASDRWMDARMPCIDGLGKLGRTTDRISISIPETESGTAVVGMKGRVESRTRISHRTGGKDWVTVEVPPGKFCQSVSLEIEAASELKIRFESSSGASTALLYALEVRDERGTRFTRFSRLKSAITLWELVPLFLIELWKWNRRLPLRPILRYLHVRWQMLWLSSRVKPGDKVPVAGPDFG